mmetsp:Transcript_662/g.2159  ORF Transcript_662/g.2159 Transcript_662/m.2159 type:complete len:231 (+) Transcript_662:139-831(+)
MPLIHRFHIPLSIVIPVRKNTNANVFLTLHHTALRTLSAASAHPCFVFKTPEITLKRLTPVSAAASSTIAISLLSDSKRAPSSHTNLRSVFQITGERLGLRSKRFTANGYTTARMLNFGSAARAIPSNVPNARALFRKYGGRTNRYLGTSAMSAARSWSNRTSGMLSSAFLTRFSSFVRPSLRLASSSLNDSAASEALRRDSTRDSNWYGFSMTSFGTSCSSPNNPATAS